MGSLGPPDRLKVIIIGAGLGGCATALAMHHAGFSVVLYEKVRKFQRLGDSLGLGENALKLLDRWSPGLRAELVEIGNKSRYMQIRRWEDGKLLARQELMDMAGFIGHRGDYHEVFLRAVGRKEGVEVRMGMEVVSYEDSETPKVMFADGTTDSADIIIAADGIKSSAREQVMGFLDKPKSSGYACFRAFFPATHLRDDPLASPYTKEECVNFWIGADVHLVQNTLRGGEEFNWILTHKDTADITESWFQPGDMAQVREIVRTLDPEIRSVIEGTESCLDWKICQRDPIPSWVSPRGQRIVLLGDSCHPHLPTSAQGASQAAESAGVLAVCLELAGKENVPLATRVYEKLRFPRTRISQTAGEDLRDRWHNVLKNLDKGVLPKPEDVEIKNRHLYDYDAEAETRKQWPVLSQIVAQELEDGKITPLC